MKRLMLAVGIAVFAESPSPAPAQSVVWTETGFVTGVSNPTFWAQLGGPIPYGATFSATFVYDSSTPESSSSSEVIGFYPGAILNSSISFGPWTFSYVAGNPGSESQIDVIDNSPALGDGYHLHWSCGSSPGSPIINLYAEDSLTSSNLSLVNGTALNIHQYDISNFQGPVAQITGNNPANGATVSIVAQVTGYTITVVPEPRAGLLAVLAATVLVMRSRQRHSPAKNNSRRRLEPTI